MGDDVRRLDAAASARTGLPHVRDHVPERALTTWVLLDVSASMAWGTAARLKSDVAEGVAQVVGRLAVRRAGRVALLTCGAAAPRLLAPQRRPRARSSALRKALAAGVAADGHAPPADALAAALRRVGAARPRARARGRGVRLPRGRRRSAERPPWARALGALAARHDVLAVEVVDPREGVLPDVGHLVLVDPETGRRTEADTAAAELRRRSRPPSSRAATPSRPRCGACARGT